MNAAFLTAMAAPSSFSNMNGGYLLSPTAGQPTPSFPTNFSDYPGGLEYFEVYHGPISSVYSEVFWTPMVNDLPPHIVERFSGGKVMAIIGQEIDQVIRVRDNVTGDLVDVSVPITMSYNHHHDSTIIGSGASFEEVGYDDPRVGQAGAIDFMRVSHETVWIANDLHPPKTKGSSNAWTFSDANGGEYRKSFHVLAPPFAALVESPTQMGGAPMQIDTWNREKMPMPTPSNPKPPLFVSGPVPAHSLAPTEGPDAVYSGLLECPLTSRIQKVYDPGCANFNSSFSVDVTHAFCPHSISDADTCFDSVAQLPGLAGFEMSTRTVQSNVLPPGCSLSVSDNSTNVLVSFNTLPSVSKASPQLVDKRHRPSVETSAGKQCDAGVDAGVSGNFTSTETGVHISLAVNATTALITLSGPADVWFGVGFNATVMADTPYVISIAPPAASDPRQDASEVVERRLQDHAAGSILKPSVTVVSDVVASQTRTVVLSRDVRGESADYFSFNKSVISIPLIHAVGSSPTFGFHRSSGAASLSLWPSGPGSFACVCIQPAAAFGEGSGVIKYTDTNETVGFRAGRCAAAPRETILEQRNPTCDIRTYVGGLSTCHHGWKLLDANQTIPWQDEPLVMFKKYRIYFQEYLPNSSAHNGGPSHVQIRRQDWGVGADGDNAEYDVPVADPATKPEARNHTVAGEWVPIPASQTNTYIVAAHFHCHAPTCLRVELWNNDTGALLCAQEPVYGGTGIIDRDTFDEAGYIATPPCLWGNPAHGLESPPLISGVTIRVVAITNNTYGHHGEMALPQISLAQGPFDWQ